MDDEKVPMTYALARFSYEASYLFNILESIYGAIVYIIIYKFLKERLKIWYTMFRGDIC